MGLVIFLFSFILSAFANLPQSCQVPSMPVQDQDGLGVCASNTASLLLQNNLGVSPAPSYIQMSITASAATKVGESFFLQGGAYSGKTFNNIGSNVCTVIDSSLASGYCDHRQFGFDFVGVSDPTHIQNEVLNQIARVLDQKAGNINRLRAELSDPAMSMIAVRRLAGLFYQNSQLCQMTPREFLARRVLERRRVVWQNTLRQSPPGQQRNVMQSMLSQAFNPDGSPTPGAVRYFQDQIEENAHEFLNYYRITDAKNRTRTTSITELRADDRYDRFYARSLGLNFEVVPAPNPNPTNTTYAQDWVAYAGCDNKTATVLDTYLQNTQCEIPSGTIPQNFRDQALSLINVLRLLGNQQIDPQAAIINVLSPSCAQQMNINQGRLRGTCTVMNVRDESEKTAAKNTVMSEICGRRAVGISLCLGFLRAQSSVNSRFCTDETPGIDGQLKHATTALGFRTMPDGRKQFFLQNSWGATCPFLQHASGFPPGLRGLAQCEMDSSNKPTGRFWVDADLLFNNTYYISTLKP